ncbi:MAG: MFS transporter [Telmatospirillum sp.]|nr:MFS transporter [Telmatospirillum sp.]
MAVADPPSSLPQSRPGPSGGSLFFRVFPPLMLPMFLGVVDQTIVATALPSIAADLGGAERMSWVVVSYLIANTIAAPVYGRLGDLFGRRRMLLAALSVMIVASTLCALAPGMTTLSIARARQGLGGGGLMTLAHSLIGEVVPPRERARYQGYIAAVVVCSNCFGPLAGGALTAAFGWRSVFLINLPLGLLAVLIARRLPSRAGTGVEGAIDGPGLLYFVAFVLPALLALERIAEAGHPSPGPVFGLAALSLLALALLLRREPRQSTPLIPVSLLRQSVIWRSGALSACHGAALVSLITFLPLYLKTVRGVPVAETGLLLLPVAVGIGAGSLLTGRLVSMTGRTMLFPSVGLVVAAALMTGLALSIGRMSPAGIAAALCVLSVFMGSVMGVVQVTVQNAAGPRLLGAAAGTVNFSRSVGAAFGTAAVSGLLFASLSRSIPDGTVSFAALVESGPEVLVHLAEGPRAAVMTAVVGGFQAVFLLIAVYVALGAILAWTVPARRLP